MSKKNIIALNVNNISHNYEQNEVIKNLSFTILSNEVVCLLGPSGCGKSSILRLISGLERLQVGKISLYDKILSHNNAEYVLPENRMIGLVFQDLALFPHLNVLDNISYGLKGIDNNLKKDITSKLLKKISIQHLENKYPHELSGGEQQRVALARALAPKPKLMLLDEPFSDLDTKLRNKIRDETISILKSTGTSVLLVTHDPVEAMLVADKIILINDKHKVQEATPKDFYYNPVNKFVASFFGDINIFNGKVDESGINFILGSFKTDKVFDHNEVEVIIRTEGVLINTNNFDNKFLIEGKILSIKHVGIFQYIKVIPDNSSEVISAKVTNNVNISNGSKVWIGFDPRFTFVFKKEKA